MEVDIFAKVAELESRREGIVTVTLLIVLSIGGRSIKLLGGWRSVNVKGKESQWSVEINNETQERGTSDKRTWLWRLGGPRIETNCHIICHVMICCCRISAAVTGGKLIR